MLRLIAILIFACAAAGAQLADELPTGIMLNLDFEQTRNGLIPSKTLYPLYTPQGELGIERFNGRNMLAFQFGQSLNIPHSSLLDPNGSEWIISIRAFPLTDGIIASQSNDDHGYAIYMKNGHIEVSVRNGHSTYTLKESERHGRAKVTKRWVTIELRIKEDLALLNLNRKRVCLVKGQPALNGENLRIRLGNHNTLPAPFKNSGVLSTGFTGAINSFKILRQ